MLTKYLSIFISLVLAIFFLSQEASACSCGPTSTVLESFEGSENVVAVRLVSVEKIGEAESEYDVNHIRSSSMIVTKVFKGALKPGDSMKFAQGGGADCIWTFDENDVDREYLFYVGKPSKGHPFINAEGDSEKEEMFSAITCGRSNSLAGARDDLAFLNNLEKVKGKTRLSGTFNTWSHDDFPQQDIEIMVHGNKRTFRTRTDKNGFFEIYDMPEGDYFAIIKLPSGWKLNTYMLNQTARGYSPYDPAAQLKGVNEIPIRVKKGEHISLDLVFDIDTAIKGRIISPSGKPMEGVCVTAASTSLKQGDYRGRSSCTNEKGEFSIEEMIDGNYILVINNDGRIDESEPFGTLFYPGVSEFDKAVVLGVERGKHTTKIDIQIPKIVELLTFKGKLLYSDDKAAEGERVEFKPDNGNTFDQMFQYTDSEGNFVFRIPRGASGTISSRMSIYESKFTDCPKLVAMFKESGKTWLEVKSTSIDFDGEAAHQINELYFPFPYCAKLSDK